MRKLLVFLFLIGLVLSQVSFGQAEKEGVIIDRGLFIAVKLVDSNVDGMVDILADLDTGATVYTFSDPVLMPESGDGVGISGEINAHGASMVVPYALVLVN